MEKIKKKLLSILKLMHPIQRGDQIIIRANETQKKDFFVLVLGEVNQPGYIPISKDNTRLGEVIEMVKGFTVNASLKRSRIFRGIVLLRFWKDNMV